jgi:hypothetical protein
MPLRRAINFKPVIELDLLNIHFPMVDVADDSKVVWGHVSEHALRKRAFRDKVKANLDKAGLFDNYRAILEGLASQLYDEGKYQRWPDRGVSVRVTNVML